MNFGQFCVIWATFVSTVWTGKIFFCIKLIFPMFLRKYVLVLLSKNRIFWIILFFIFRNKFLAEHRKSHFDAEGNLPCPQWKKSFPNYTEMAKHMHAIHNVGPIYEFWPILCNLGNFCQLSVDTKDFLLNLIDFFNVSTKILVLLSKSCIFKLFFLFSGTNFWLNIGKVI